MAKYNGKTIERLTPIEAWERGYFPGSQVAGENKRNEELRPGQITQLVYVDSEYMGICVKRDKLWQVVEKFKI